MLKKRSHHQTCNPLILIMFFIFSMQYNSSALSATQEALDIMIKTDRRDDGDNRIADMTMVLVDKHGDQRVRTLKVYTKDYGDDVYRIMFFKNPLEVKNTAFLTYDYDDVSEDDDQWLFLPSLNKSKRISNSDQTSSFMGSDFTYADMTKRNIDAYDFSLKKKTKINGSDAWVIDAIPNTEEEVLRTGYKRWVAFVDQNSYVITRSIFWEESSNKVKLMDVKSLELIDDIWTPTEIHMTTTLNKKQLHKTLIKFDNIRYLPEMTKDTFTLRRLERGL